MQVVGVTALSGIWRRSKRRTRMLQRLNWSLSRFIQSLFNRGCMSTWPRSADRWVGVVSWQVDSRSGTRLSGKAGRVGRSLDWNDDLQSKRYYACPNKDSLYAVVVRLADDWVSRNVASGGNRFGWNDFSSRQKQLRVETWSADAGSAASWSVIDRRRDLLQPEVRPAVDRDETYGGRVKLQAWT